nr:hypothetical protein [Methanosarcina barkeri]
MLPAILAYDKAADIARRNGGHTLIPVRKPKKAGQFMYFLLSLHNLK